MNRALFGTDGVRGLAGKYPLDMAGAEQIGKAVGVHFAELRQRIVIACDTRQSSEGLVTALTKGLNSVGVNVTSLGVIPTPGLAYMTREDDQFVAGVMVTASHNPYEYNGIKVFDKHGDKLTDAVEAELNSLIENGVARHGSGEAVQSSGLIAHYEDFLVNSARGLDLGGMRLAIDSANGAASGLAERVFSRLGAQITALFNTPDGRNINAGCGATDTKALREKVLADELDLGIALDGDADRLAMVDKQGREVNGDHLMYMLAAAGQLNGVVATVMSNFGFERALQERDIPLERVNVGDRYVLEGLKRTGFQIGGEQSGHIIFPELLATGDGLLAAVQALSVIATSREDLAQWRDKVTFLPQALVNIKLADKALLDRSDVQDFILEQTSQLAGKGRLLIRPSGTEPLARVMVEAPEAQAITHQIAAKLEKLLSQAAEGDTK